MINHFDIEIAKPLKFIMKLVQLWTRLLEVSRKPTVQLVAVLHCTGSETLRKIMNLTEMYVDLEWTDAARKMVNKAVPVFLGYFQQKMLPNKIHYLAAYLNPLTRKLKNLEMLDENGDLDSLNQYGLCRGKIELFNF